MTKTQNALSCGEGSEPAPAGGARSKIATVVLDLLKAEQGATLKGGTVYRRGTLYHLLSNRIHRGMIVHKGTAYPGDHEAIVEEDLFEYVQMKLADDTSGSSRRRQHRQPSLLTGMLFDGEGRSMIPSHASRPNRRYRYYVTRPDGLDGTPAWRVSAHDLEQLVCRSIADKLIQPSFILDLQGEAEIEVS